MSTTSSNFVYRVCDNIHTIVVVVFFSKDMAEVANWLIEQGVFFLWVGGKDINSLDLIEWITDGREISVSLWGSGEPQHVNGNCVLLQTGGASLHIADCDTPYYVLCQLHM